MSSIIDKPNFYTQLQALHTQHSDLLDEAPITLDKPLPPIGEISEQRLGIRSSWGVIRGLFLIPWLLGLCFVLAYKVNDINEGWKLEETFIIRYIETSKKQFGPDYFEWTNNDVSLKMYRRIDENGKMPLENYLDFLYYDSVGGQRRLQADIFLTTLTGLGIPGLLIALLSFRRRAPLYFDRDKGFVYTWRKGHVWAQHYRDLWYYENQYAMTFILYSEDKKGRLKPRRFVVTPTGNPFGNGSKVYRPLLVVIAHFMEKGRDAVWSSDWQGRRGWYLFNDNQPKDFDTQLKTVLQRLENDKVFEQVNAQVAAWAAQA